MPFNLYEYKDLGKKTICIKDLKKNITKGENMINETVTDFLMHDHYVTISGCCTTAETDPLLSFPSHFLIFT